jgi:hypothetical protein
MRIRANNSRKMARVAFTFTVAGVLFMVQLAMGQAVLSPVAQDSVKPAAPAEAVVSANSLLPDLPSLPRGKATLVGGSISRLDRVRDQVTVRVFGGGPNMKVLFDERTRVYRDGAHASQRDLETGQKVYVETVLDGSKIFARTIHLVTQSSVGESQGQVIDYDAATGDLLLRDELSPEPVKLHVSSSTVISREGQQGAANLVEGALVTVKFQPGSAGRREVSQISILATPGTAFTFVGQVTALDVHAGLMVMVDPRDQKRYEISFDPDRIEIPAALREGSQVTVSAGFDGNRYVASTLAVNTAATQ